jgi:hypothetical protein
MNLVSITKDDNDKNKMVAVFEDKETGKTKTTHFGAVGYTDYTLSKDKEKRKLYLARHKARENWDDYTSAGSLSKHILWGDTTSIEKNIKAFKKKFKL